MKTKAITELMVKDHLKIFNLVHSLDKSLGKSTLEIQNIFKSLSSVLEKHLYIEEKAIFTQDEIVDTTEFSQIISKLFAEHKRILAMLKDMKKAFKKGRDFDFQSFKEILLNHKDYEEEIVYPKLDQDLDEDIKEEIIDRIIKNI